jgi:hypothetical protein
MGPTLTKPASLLGPDGLMAQNPISINLTLQKLSSDRQLHWPIGPTYLEGTCDGSTAVEEGSEFERWSNYGQQGIAGLKNQTPAA